MQRRYATVDVFTDRIFGGNPLAVVLDAAGLSTAQMQAIATEFNYSETTFVLPPREAVHTAWVRIFTPTAELPFAGHPNVGTAFVLAQQAAARGGMLPEKFLFEEAAGLVPVRLLTEDGGVIAAELSAPERLSRRAQPDPAQVAACLSLAPGDIAMCTHPPQVASVGLAFLMVELVSRNALRRASPVASLFRGLLPLDGANSLYVYTPDVYTLETWGDAGSDVQARMFMPRMTEDPATGSATAAMVALRAELMPGADGDLALRVAQGVDMGRPSLLLARAHKWNNVVESAHVGGRCVAVMAGTFYLGGEY